MSKTLQEWARAALAPLLAGVLVTGLMMWVDLREVKRDMRDVKCYIAIDSGSRLLPEGCTVAPNRANVAPRDSLASLARY